jgi:hypothetical protein
MKKRSLSEFMCIEMLYDYVSQNLDGLRTQAVEECLMRSPRVRDELKKLNLGMAYCEKLKEVKVSVPLVEAIMSQPKPAQRVLSRMGFKSLPQPVKWGLEAVVVAVAIALFVTQVPELFKAREDSLVVRQIETAQEIEAPAVQQPFESEQLPPLAQNTQKPETQKPTLKETIQPVVAVAPTATIPTSQPQESSVAQTVPSAPVAAAKSAKRQGYVYRLVMFTDQVDEITPQIVALIQSNGGEKAGEVELGWRRKGGSYFHFTLPQQNYAIVIEGLKKFGNFNIVKSEHPRVMPEGVERFILWVEEKKQ